ncbi:hypothetical protein [Massilia scottii]|uniref:hypothetical protein n=1 Tax=Massilia scottii TaxID=3057166 RepID=UPI002796D995|nr:hypothetical protein [Massilia sp. CCM 9029]MDQ1831871.1 hypothetical protein [Massilia sp. CCM 9029]
MLAVKGRIGRLRYLVYLSLSAAPVLGAVALMPATNWTVFPRLDPLMLVMVVVLPAAMLTITRRRC